MFALNDKEEEVIGTFVMNQDKYYDAKMILKWENGSKIVTIYRNYLEDSNDFEPGDEEYEEFWSILFEVIQVNGNPPVYISPHNLFTVNYHNSPDEIIADGKKIN